MDPISKTNLHVVSQDDPRDPWESEAPLRDGDRTVLQGKELLDLYPAGYMKRSTALWLALLVVSAAVDVATMYLVIAGKFTDAFGNPTAGTFVTAFGALLTLMVFMLISLLWDPGRATGRAAAVVVWHLLVVFLVFTLWPNEVSALKALWISSLPAVAGFGITVRASLQPPLWFLVAGVAVTAVVCTLPGLTFLFAKAEVARIHQLWRLREQAGRLVAEEVAIAGVEAACRTSGAIADHFDSPVAVDSAVSAVLQDSMEAYRDALGLRIAQAETILHGPAAITSRQRHECESVLQQAQAALGQLAGLKA